MTYTRLGGQRGGVTGAAPTDHANGQAQQVRREDLADKALNYPRRLEGSGEPEPSQWPGFHRLPTGEFVADATA